MSVLIAYQPLFSPIVFITSQRSCALIPSPQRLSAPAGPSGRYVNKRKYLPCSESIHQRLARQQEKWERPQPSPPPHAEITKKRDVQTSLLFTFRVNRRVLQNSVRRDVNFENYFLSEQQQTATKWNFVSDGQERYRAFSGFSLGRRSDFGIDAANQKLTRSPIFYN